MELFIDNYQVDLENLLQPNFNYAFLDTYNPSSVKSSYSKTIKIPKSKSNLVKPRGDFEIRDNGRVLQKGYYVLDSETQEKTKAYYEITLYGQLGDFFYHLSSGSLADLYYGWKGSRDVEDRFKIEWSNDYVYYSWNRPRDSFEANLVPIPCVTENKNFDYKKTVIEDKLFKVPSGYSLIDGKYSLVETEDSTTWLRQNFQTDIMPLGLRYSEIIKACTRPENNGGYTVNLDPSFFNNKNPYWKDLFVLFEQPAQDYGNVTEDYGNFSLGNQTEYSSSGDFTNQVTPTANSEVWNINGNSLVTTKTIITNKLEVSFTPKFKPTQESSTNSPINITRYDTTITFRVTNSNGEYREASLEWGSGTELRASGGYLVYPKRELSIELPRTWSNLSIRYTISLSKRPTIRGITLNDFEVGDPIVGNVVIPSQSNKLILSTSYVDVNNTQYEYSQYTKKDLLGSSDTPLDYLLSFTKMFNLRFYQHPGSKIIDILSWDNWFTDKVDIQDWIDYSNYQAIPKVSDSKELHFGIEPDKNTTVEEYLKVNSSVFDRTVPINSDSTSTEEYLDTNLKLGSRANLTGYYSVRPVNNLAYYGFDSPDSYKVGYLQGEELKTVDQNLARQFGNQRYTVLELSEVKNTVVLRCGTSVNNYGGESGKYPIAISRTSRLMVQYAGKPCFVGGFDLGAGEGSTDVILGCPIKYTYQIPCFDVVSNTQGSGVSLSFSNVHYRSLNVSSNLFDTRFRLMLDQIYSRPLQVKTKVHWKAMPQLRQLYYFNNTFWMISEVSNYNYTDAPADTVFTRVLF